VHGPPDNIVVGQHEDAQYEGDDGQVLEGIFCKQWPGIKLKEFAHHPVSIGAYPEYDGHIMAYLTHELPGADGNDNSDNEGRKDHRNA